MKTQRYFLNEETGELIIVTQEDGEETNVETMNQICAFEFEDEEEEAVIEKKVKPVKSGKVRGGGLADESWRHNRRVTKKQKEQVKELMAKGFNSQKISEEIDEDLEFTNEIIDKVKGADMNFKIDEEEGISI